MSDTNAVIARHRAFVESFGTEDVARMSGYLTEDHVGMPPGQPQMEGRAAAEDFWRKGFAMARSAFTTRDQSVLITGDFAIDRFGWDMTITPRDGSDPVADTGKCVWIWRRERDGEWRLATAIWNSDQARPGMWSGG